MMPTCVKIPERIKALPLDSRGYPIPFFAAVIDGKPDLRFSDGKKMNECHEKNLCWVCGTALRNSVCFIGGPRSAQSGVYSDGPMHRDCAEFSLMVCPHMVLSMAKRRDNNMPEHVHKAPGHVDERPEYYVLYIVTNKSWSFDRRNMLFLNGKPNCMIKWKDGAPL